MAVELKTYDVAEQLDNEEEIRLYLEAAFEDGDAAIIRNAIANVARARGMKDESAPPAATGPAPGARRDGCAGLSVAPPPADWRARA